MMNEIYDLQRQIQNQCKHNKLERVENHWEEFDSYGATSHKTVEIKCTSCGKVIKQERCY